MSFKHALGAVSTLAAMAGSAAFAESHAKTITIATVNNGDMVRMQGYTDSSPKRPASMSSG